MYYGDPPAYHVAGLSGTPVVRLVVHANFHRGLLYVMRVALVLGERELLEELHEFRCYYDQVTGWTDKPVGKLMAKLKKE